MKNQSYVWHPNTQMLEWLKFPKIVRGNGMWLIDQDGNKFLDGVASMWCNVWGHSKKELVDVIIKQTKKLQHSSLFNFTNEPIEILAKKLTKLSPGMAQVFFSDNGSTAMEVSIKMALQYWNNLGLKNKTKITTLENGYHGDTFGAMSVGYVPEFFSKFRTKLFSTVQFPVPNSYHMPNNFTKNEFTDYCLEKIDKKLCEDESIAAFVMESGAQVAGGVNIYPVRFQKQVNEICRKYDVLFVLDEIATGFGRLGSMVEYKNQKCRPDIVSFGKMLTGGYLTLAATLMTKKISDSFLGRFSEMKHLFHGHTYTPMRTKKSINKIVFDEGKKHHIFFRTLGNIIMLVPPLAISKKEINLLIDGTLDTIKGITRLTK